MVISTSDTSRAASGSMPKIVLNTMTVPNEFNRMAIPAVKTTTASTAIVAAGLLNRSLMNWMIV